MRIFLAASWMARSAVQPYAEQLRDDGHDVVSGWHDPAAPEDTGDAAFAAAAARDLDDIAKADAVAVLTWWPSTSGGRHAELLGAHALGKTVCVVGPLRHGNGRTEPIYAWLPSVRRFAVWPEFRRWAREARRSRDRRTPPPDALCAIAREWPIGAEEAAGLLQSDFPNVFGQRLAGLIRGACTGGGSEIAGLVRAHPAEAGRARLWLLQGASDAETCRPGEWPEAEQTGKFQRALARLIDAELVSASGDPAALANYYPDD